MDAIRKRVIIFTALPIEYQAVQAHLQDLQEVAHPSGSQYEQGVFAGVGYRWNVLLVQTGMGNPRAAFEVERAIAYYQPSHVFFTGVAGGIKDVRIGDVVAATKVYAIEAGKADEEYRPRPDFGESSYPMVQHANVVARKKQWVNRIKMINGGEVDSPPNALVGPIAAGEKVIASTDSAAYAAIRRYFSDALAIEMESFGFFRAVYANRNIQALAIRGISDLIDGKHAADAGGSQERAVSHAAAFTFEVFHRLATPENIAVLLDDNWWSSLVLVASQLYPQGPVDQSIWLRSGGDLATINIQGNGRTTWFSALQVLRLGGGGKSMTLNRLLNVMLQDFPGNTELVALSASLA